jgi:hypothetical protein
VTSLRLWNHGIGVSRLPVLHPLDQRSREVLVSFHGRKKALSRSQAPKPERRRFGNLSQLRELADVCLWIRRHLHEVSRERFGGSRRIRGAFKTPPRLRRMPADPCANSRWIASLRSRLRAEDDLLSSLLAVLCPEEGFGAQFRGEFGRVHHQICVRPPAHVRFDHHRPLLARVGPTPFDARPAQTLQKCSGHAGQATVGRHRVGPWLARVVPVAVDRQHQESPSRLMPARITNRRAEPGEELMGIVPSAGPIAAPRPAGVGPSDLELRGSASPAPQHPVTPPAVGAVSHMLREG